MFQIPFVAFIKLKTTLPTEHVATCPRPAPGIAQSDLKTKRQQQQLEVITVRHEDRDVKAESASSCEIRPFALLLGLCAVKTKLQPELGFLYVGETTGFMSLC